MKKQRSAAEGKANEELSASPIKNYRIKSLEFRVVGLQPIKNEEL